MKIKQRSLSRAAALLLVVLPACTMKSQEAPDFTGPSEFGKSINVTVTPDAIVQDGASQSVVTVTALGVNAQPLANIPLRAEIRVDDVPTDFGSLSARNLVTDANGRATLVYTAPATVPGAAIDTQTVVQIGVTAASGDAANAVTRFANLRLLPPGRVGPPSDLPLSFTTGTPSTGEVAAPLAFAVIPPEGQTIVRYNWNFGDGAVATTQVPSASHAYMQSGSFVRLGRCRELVRSHRDRVQDDCDRPVAGADGRLRRLAERSGAEPGRPVQRLEIRARSGTQHRQLQLGLWQRHDGFRSVGAGGLQPDRDLSGDVDRDRRSRPPGRRRQAGRGEGADRDPVIRG